MHDHLCKKSQAPFMVLLGKDKEKHQKFMKLLNQNSAGDFNWEVKGTGELLFKTHL
jgi:hypothetical protein